MFSRSPRPSAQLPSRSSLNNLIYLVFTLVIKALRFATTAAHHYHCIMRARVRTHRRGPDYRPYNI